MTAPISSIPGVVTRMEALAWGLKRYFTGKPCGRGHICQRLTSCGTCIECEWISSDVYRRKNRKKTRDATDKSHAKNPKYRVTHGVGSQLVCKICQKPFVKVFPNQVVCSDICSHENDLMLKRKWKKERREA